MKYYKKKKKEHTGGEKGELQFILLSQTEATKNLFQGRNP